MFETFELSARYLDELTGDTDRCRDPEGRGRAQRPAEIDHRPAAAIARPVGYRRRGEPLVSGTVYPMPKINLSDRDYFRAQKDNAKAGTYVSEVLKARAADTTFFTLSRRRADAKGSFGGVTTVSIAPEYFINFYAKLPPPGVFALIRDDGAILARYPDLSTRLEKLSPESHRDAEHRGHSPTRASPAAHRNFDGTDAHFRLSQDAELQHLCGVRASRARS